MESLYKTKQAKIKVYQDLLSLIGDSGNKDHLIPEQIDQVFVWRKTEQISWRSF